MARAAKFTLGAQSFSLASVSLPLSSLVGLENETNFTVSIVADANGSPNGALLEKVVTRPMSIGPFGEVHIVSYSSSLQPVLAGGKSYWVVAEPKDPDIYDSTKNFVYLWHMGVVPGDTADRIFNFEDNSWGGWDTYSTLGPPAFRIEGTPIPEPGACGLLILGASIGVLSHWRRRAADRI